MSSTLHNFYTFCPLIKIKLTILKQRYIPFLIDFYSIRNLIDIINFSYYNISSMFAQLNSSNQLQSKQITPTHFNNQLSQHAATLLDRQAKNCKITKQFKESIKATMRIDKDYPSYQTKSVQKISLQNKNASQEQKQKINQCKICTKIFKVSVNNPKMFNCSHNLLFCQSCLHHYAIFKIAQFQEVICPQEVCKTSIDSQGQFFKGLPINIQQKYRKIERFTLTKKDSSLKLCPQQTCQGFIKLFEQETMVCTKCRAVFCANCLLPKHESVCDKYELQFFIKNLQFRQCKRCKMIIQCNKIPNSPV